MSIYELDISWAETANERRYLRWELLACQEVRGVFLTARDEVLAVLFTGDRHSFHEWARALAPWTHGAGVAAPRSDSPHHPPLATGTRPHQPTQKGVLK